MNLILGDCLEEMKTIQAGSIDMVLCDLPYGTTKCSWDVIIPFEQLWEQYNRICKDNAAIVLFGQEPFTTILRMSNLQNYRYDWYWEKERATNIMQMRRRPGKTVETISVFYKEQCKYFPQMSIHTGPKRTNKIKNGKLGTLVDNNNKKPNEYEDTGVRYPTQILKYQRDVLTSNLHPTQKPVALLEYLIKTYSSEGDLILDNTMGSGSAGVACVNTNRDFIGIEKELEYFEIAKTRIDELILNNSKQSSLKKFIILKN